MLAQHGALVRQSLARYSRSSFPSSAYHGAVRRTFRNGSISEKAAGAVRRAHIDARDQNTNPLVGVAKVALFAPLVGFGVAAAAV